MDPNWPVAAGERRGGGHHGKGGDYATGGVVEGEEKMIQRRPIQEGGKVVWRDGRSAVMSDLATLHAKKHPISNVLNALSARPDIFGSEENSG